MAIASHRNRNRTAPFFPKKSHLQIASKPTKNRICYPISKMNKNNLRLLRFRFFINCLRYFTWLWVTTVEKKDRQEDLFFNLDWRRDPSGDGWTDGSFPSPLGTGGASIHTVCGRCSSSSSLSYSAGPVSSSFSAESSVLVRGLEWCHSHLKTCHFQSDFFLTDSLSALTLLSSAPPFLQTKSFWDILDLSDSLSSCVALSFQWVPVHAGFSGNERAVSFARTGAILPVAHVSCPLAPTIAKIRHTRYSLWRRALSQNPSPARFLRFPRRNWPSPSYPLWTVSTSLPGSQPSFVLLPMQDKKEGEFFM